MWWWMSLILLPTLGAVFILDLKERQYVWAIWALALIVWNVHSVAVNR